MIEVEPQSTSQVQPVLVRIGQTAAALHDPELRTRGHPKRGVPAPLLRHIRLRRIDPRDTLDRGDTQPIVGRKTPYFLAREAGFPG